MAGTRDSQRSRVTRAMFVESNTKCTRAEAMVTLAAKLMRSKWFTNNFVPIGGRDAFAPFKWTKSRRALAYALAWYHRERYSGKSRSTRWAYQRGAMHGREFCHVLLRFVEKLEGKAAADAMREAFKVHKVKYSKPRERRALPPAQRAAMIARLDGMRAKRATRTDAPAVERCVQPNCGQPLIPGDPWNSHTPACKWFGIA
jgi:hypothetical protein